MAEYVLVCRRPERPDGPSLASRLLDVGPGGVCIETGERLLLGQQLVLEIRIPGDPDRFRAQAVVAWSGERAAGLRFDHVDEDADLPSPAEERRTSDPRRRHKRFFPGRGEVAFAPETFWTQLGFRPRNRALRLVDISPGGAHLVCGERVKTGGRGWVRLEFWRPRVVVDGEARVVWCRRDTLLLAPEWHVGVTFRRIADPHAIRALERQFLG